MYSGLMPLLPQIRQAGVDIFASIDPMALGVDGRAIREAFGRDVAVCGGINNYHVMERGTPDQVRAAVNEALALFSPPEGCILAPSDVLLLGNPETITRNVQVMIDAWRKGGAAWR
jgi:uroporphyrinogen decarboxylase